MTTITDPNQAAGPTQNSTDPAASSPAIAPPTDDEPPVDASPSRRRRWPIAVAGVAAAGAIATVVVTASRDGEETDTAEPVELTTVTAEVGDLVRFSDVDGRMVYADTDVVTATSDGVVTDVIEPGTEVAGGDVVAEVNGSPIVAFVGDVPLYRPLAAGATGDDVLLVEQNLAALGSHTELDDDGEPIDDGFLADGVWDDATTTAVMRWQEDLDVEATGQIDPTDLVVLSGDAVVVDASAELGDRVAAGSPLIELSPQSDTETFHSAHSGEFELLVSSGDAIAAGDVVYVVDDLPVSAVVAPDGIERELRDGVEDGTDVTAVESMLVSLGYDAGGDLVVDEEFDEATETAVTDWQEDLQNTWEDVPVDGRVGPEDLLVVEDGQMVGVVTDHDTDVLVSGTELWSTASATTTRVVETAIEVADQDRLAVAQVVDVEFPDGTIVQGTVVDVASSTTVDPLTPNAEPTLAVEIALAEVPASAAELVDVDVTIKLVDELVSGVVIVPAGALVATGDGGFAVEAVTTTGTRLVPVEPGMFDDGFVEVSGIQAGVQVVVP